MPTPGYAYAIPRPSPQLVISFQVASDRGMNLEFEWDN